MTIKYFSFNYLRTLTKSSLTHLINIFIKIRSGLLMIEIFFLYVKHPYKYKK